MTFQQETFQKLFDVWLWEKEKTFNPFTRCLAELAEDNPEVPEPEFSPEISEERRYEEHQKNGIQ